MILRIYNMWPFNSPFWNKQNHQNGSMHHTHKTHTHICILQYSAIDYLHKDIKSILVIYYVQAPCFNVWRSVSMCGMKILQYQQQIPQIEIISFVVAELASARRLWDMWRQTVLATGNCCVCCCFFHVNSPFFDALFLIRSKLCYTKSTVASLGIFFTNSATDALLKFGIMLA